MNYNIKGGYEKMMHNNHIKELAAKPHPKKRVSIIKTISVKEHSILYGARQINNPALAAGLARDLYQNSDREMLIVGTLDAKCSPLSLEIAAIGNINTCIVSPREIFKYAIISNAVHIIVFHNHVSGCCEPSAEDITVTKRLVDVGDLLGIPLVDHIIIGDGDTYLSLRESGFASFNNGSSAYLKEV